MLNADFSADGASAVVLTSSGLELWRVEPTPRPIATLALGDLGTGAAFGVSGSLALLVPWVEHKLRVYGASGTGITLVKAVDLAGPNPDLPAGNFAGLGYSSNRVAVSYMDDSTTGDSAPVAADATPQTIVVYDAGTWSERARLDTSTLGGRRAALAVLGDGRVMAASGKGVRLWSADLKEAWELKLSAQPTTLAPIARSDRVAAGLEDGSIVLIDAGALSVLASEPAHPGPVEYLSASSTRLVSVGEAGSAAIWRMN